MAERLAAIRFVESPVYRLAELLEDESDARLPGAWDWGVDVGREAVE